MPKSKPPTIEAVRKAVEILIAYGRTRYSPEARSRMSRGQCIGLAVASVNDAPAIVDMAIAALEDWNGHLSVACLSAIEQGQGVVERKGRMLTITLPEHWGRS